MNAFSDNQNEPISVEDSSVDGTAVADAFARTNLTLATPDDRLRVRFAWIEDRFWHRVTLEDADIFASASSIEGNAQDDWPRSPPLQQLSLEEINGKPVIFGVGAAGKSHWSVSVQAIATEAGPGLKFEWACRHNKASGFLGTTYQHTGTLRIIAEDDASQQSSGASETIIEPANRSSSRTDCWSYVMVAPADDQTSRA